MQKTTFTDTKRIVNTKIQAG